MVRLKKYHKPLPHGFDDVLSSIANENKPTKRTLSAKPFIKWVGGKRSIVSKLLERLPEEYTNYYEPFLGGGALFFAIQPNKAYLSDINFHLIITFRAVRDDADRLIHNLKIHDSKNNKDYYLKARERLHKEQDPTKIASLFIYLNKTCFNGLYRVNKSGKFNVPIGSYKNPNILDEENLLNSSTTLKGAKIHQRSFLQTNLEKGAFYYLDPPYHETYSGYNGGGFGEKEHKLLALFCKKIDEVGGCFMLSNSDTELVNKLYKTYNIERVSASRSVSCKAHQRGKENELIIRNYK